MQRVLVAIVVSSICLGEAKIVRKDVTMSGIKCGGAPQQGGVFVYDDEVKEKLPLIGYAHGWTDGGHNVDVFYKKLWPLLVEAGYVIIAQKAPDGMAYCDFEYEDQLRAVEWAQSASEILDHIDLKTPASIVGHSMGGRATVLASSQADLIKALNIGAAVAQHPSVNVDGCPKCAPVVPIMFTTGNKDTTVPPKSVKGQYDLTQGQPKAFVELKGAGHLDPKTEGDLQGNYVLDWLNCFIKHNNTACHLSQCNEPQQTSPTTACESKGVPSAFDVVV